MWSRAGMRKKSKIQSAFVRTSLLVYQSGAEGVQLCVGVLPFGLEVVYPSRSLEKLVREKGLTLLGVFIVFCLIIMRPSEWFLLVDS